MRDHASIPSIIYDQILMNIPDHDHNHDIDRDRSISIEAPWPAGRPAGTR